MRGPPKLTPAQAAARRQLLEEQAEYEAELAARREQLRHLIDLLAWVLAQSHQPRSLRDPKNWPRRSIIAEPLYRAIALRDPLLFNLARQQVAASMQDASRHVSNLHCPDRRAFIVRLMSQDEPLKRSAASDNFARDVLVIAVVKFAYSEGLWPEAEKKLPVLSSSEAAGKVRFEAFSPPLNIHGAAMKLLHLLNEHPRLASLPDAVLSEAAIRAILAKRNKLFDGSCSEVAELL